MPHHPAAIDSALVPIKCSRDEVDEILARAGIFGRVETSALSALTERL